jgi:hypothetical protein
LVFGHWDFFGIWDFGIWDFPAKPGEGGCVVIVLSRRAVFGLLGVGAAAAARRVVSCAAGEFEYGAHWRWGRGEEFFTGAGVELLAARLRGAGFDADAEAILARLDEAARAGVERKNEPDMRGSPAPPEPHGRDARAARIGRAEEGEYWWQRD